MQALFDMHPEILARIREGVDIDQLVRDFPQEVMEDVMGRVAEALDGNAAAIPEEQRGMPGGGFEVEDEGADREGDEVVSDPTEAQGDDEADGDDDEPVSPFTRARSPLMLIHHVTFSFFLCAWFGICLVDYGAILLRRTKRRVRIQTTKVTRLEEGEKNQELMTWTDLSVRSLGCLW